MTSQALHSGLDQYNVNILRARKTVTELCECKNPAELAVEPVANRGKRAADKPTRRAILKTWAKVIAAWPMLSRAGAASERSIKWVVFYGQTTDERVLATYDIVVLDPMFEGSISTVGASGARVCAYLSLGEIKTSNPFFDQVDRAALLEENPTWPETWRIDVRHHSWRDLVLGAMIPAIALKGFSGLMFDTLDTPPYLEQMDPKGNAGLCQAAADLVHAIRKHHPSMMLMMNRGYALLPKVINSIDRLVAESLLTIPAKGGSGFDWNSPTQVALQLSLMAPALRREPRLPILSLDYWDPKDVRTIEKIYLRERQLGHHPYVATPLLDRIIPEPDV